MNLQQLEDAWQAKYPHSDPIADNLKYVYPKKWIRIHTLEDGKRYAENEHESKLILERHIGILEQLGAEKEKLLILTCGWSNTPEKTPSEASKIASMPRMQYWKSILNNPEETDLNYISYTHLYVHEAQLNGLADLLEKVANDEVAGVIIMPPKLEWLYHPYDGGADIICSEAMRTKIKNQFSDLMA